MLLGPSTIVGSKKQLGTGIITTAVITALLSLGVPRPASAAAMIAEDCAKDIQGASLKFLAIAKEDAEKIADIGHHLGPPAEHATVLASSAVLATGAAMAGITAATSGFWRVSQGFWKLLGNNDPISSMPNPLEPTTLRSVDLEQIYEVAGVSPDDVAGAASLFPVVQADFNMIAVEANYFTAVEGFATAYTKFLEARIEAAKGGPSADIYEQAAIERAAEVRAFSPILQTASTQLSDSETAQIEAENQFQEFYTNVTGNPPSSFTPQDVLALETEFATNGFPADIAGVMSLFGLSDAEINSVAQDSLNIPPEDVANMVSCGCAECGELVRTTVLADLPEPPTALILGTGMFLLFGYCRRRQTNITRRRCDNQQCGN